MFLTRGCLVVVTSCYMFSILQTISSSGWFDSRGGYCSLYCMSTSKGQGGWQEQQQQLQRLQQLQQQRPRRGAAHDEGVRDVDQGPQRETPLPEIRLLITHGSIEEYANTIIHENPPSASRREGDGGRLGDHGGAGRSAAGKLPKLTLSKARSCPEAGPGAWNYCMHSAYTS